MELLRVAQAAKRLGLSTKTVRRWATSGRLEFVWVGTEHRFSTDAIDAALGKTVADRPRQEALYVRVSGSSGQESSLLAQEQELRQTATGTVVRVFKDRASGLKEDRRGLTQLLKAAAEGNITVVRVTHEDRLARFGTRWLRALLARDQVSVEVLHPKSSAGGMEELLADFISLVTTFAGRMYGIRSRDARRRLLQAAAPPGGAGRE